LDIHGTVIERLDTPEMTAAEGDTGEDDEDAGAGPIAIAVDMTESDAPAAEAPSDTTAP
jgi:exoribonuclease-2